MIQVFGADLGPAEEAAVRAAIRDQWLGCGPRVARFESRFAELRGLPGLVLVDSGTNGLWIALTALELPPGSEIIVPACTWVGCAHAVRLAGHEPVFCDVDPATGNATIETIAPLVGPRTGAIMVVHYAGRPVEMDPILALGLPVIEDAAHAAAASWRGRACGSLGAVGVFSFDGVKNIAMGAGGGITAPDPERLARARTLRGAGLARTGIQGAIPAAAPARGRAPSSPERWWEVEPAAPFPKCMPTDLAAAVGLAQLARLEELQGRRRRLMALYDELLAALPWVDRAPPFPPESGVHGCFTVLVRVPARDALARALLENGVYTTLRFPPLHRTRLYARDVTLPGAEEIGERGLNLPLHPRMMDEDVARVLELLRRFGRGHADDRR